jgi:glycosyltransferase involved in cell wall biosynthesis
VKILHLSSARSDGGGERHLTDLVNGLAIRGHELHVACAPDTSFIRRLSPEQIITFNFHPASFIQTALRLSRSIRERQIDILHAHLGRDYPLAALVSKMSGARLIVTRHVLFPLGKIHRLTFAQAARIVAVSEAVGKTLRAQKLCPPEKIVVIKNGLALESFVSHSSDNSFRQQIGARPDQLLFGMCGELSPVKNQEDFLRAAALVTQEHPNALFLIAGEDQTQSAAYRQKLEQLIRDLGLDARVRLLGWVESVAPFLSSLDIFVSASRTESFGLAIVEAMASGLPVVATETAGAKEIIFNERTGLLVPVGDVDSLATAMSNLINNYITRQQLGENARTYAQENFSLARMIKETEQLYHETEKFM